MSWKVVFGVIFFIFVVVLLVFYWVIPFPFNTVDFGFKEKNYNFSTDTNLTGNLSGAVQFYPNMRFPTPEISYNILNCPLQRQNDMEMAFAIVSNLTPLIFYPVANGEEVSITCDSKNVIQEGLFVAGEGGPTNVTRTSDFNVIMGGQILLLKDSGCPSPNIAIHELFHVLGFDHSKNPNNVMYPYSNCNQEIGQDIPDTINRLYAIPSLEDLSIENVSAVMHGLYLNANITIMNDGLKDSENFKVRVYADGSQVEELDGNSLKIGYGRSIMLKNIFVLSLDVKEIKFTIDYPGDELSKKNNEITLSASSIK